MKEGKDIDQLFKDGLGEPEIPFNDLDWAQLEERLHPKPNRRLVPVFWLSAVAGIAALLLVVFLFLKPGREEAQSNSVVKNTGKTNTDIAAKPKPENNTTTEVETTLPPEKGLNQANNQIVGVNTNSKVAAHQADQLRVLKQNSMGGIIEYPIADNPVFNNSTLANVDYHLASLNSPVQPVEIEALKVNMAFAKSKIKKLPEPIMGKKSRFVLSILAAPDLTSVQKSGQSSLSGSFGVEATYMLTKKLSVTTGAAYAKKIYDSDFSLYNPNSSYVFRVQPTNIHANCDVIDIPLNLNYTFFDNKKNSITVSTGLSSYFMVKEKYNFSYDSIYGRPQSFEVRNQNQHYFGVANVGIAFQHKINEKLSISARPFMKIPVSNIGYGNSKLSSTGVAVSVNMNLFRKAN